MSQLGDEFGAVEAERADAEPWMDATGHVEAPIAIRVLFTAWGLMDARVIDSHVTVGR